MPSLDSVVAQCLKQYPASHYYLAFSGGLDSTALLHVLSSLLPADKLTAIHVHHGLLPEADAWVEHCQTTCAAYGVSCKVQYAKLAPKKGDSVEELARKARYTLFSEVLMSEDILLTAHHADDQAETFMLNALRGAGTAGLAAMPLSKPLVKLSKATLCRPLLSQTQQQLRDYANLHQLSWIEDPSNQDDRFNRNYLRKHIMPLLQDRWPAVADTLSRSAALISDSLVLLEDLAAMDTAIQPGQLKPLCIANLAFLSQKRRFNSLRYWLSQYNTRLPSKAVLEEIDTAMFAENDTNPQIVLDEFVVRRYQGALYCMLEQGPEIQTKYDWDISKPLSIHQSLVIYPADLGEMGKQLQAKNVVLQVRFRAGGERILLPGRDHHHQVKKLLQERSVPPWLRDQLPMVYYQEQLIAVLGLSPPILGQLPL